MQLFDHDVISEHEAQDEHRKRQTDGNRKPDGLQPVETPQVMQGIHQMIYIAACCFHDLAECIRCEVCPHADRGEQQRWEKKCKPVDGILSNRKGAEYSDDDSEASV
jgi:hypothetical protein